MKAWLLKLLINYIIDILIEVCRELSTKTNNTIDDVFVKTLADNKLQIKIAVKDSI